MKTKKDSKRLLECPRCLFTEDIADIGEKQCNYCDLHDRLSVLSENEFKADIVRIKNTKGKYNCLIGISGGLDSSTLLYWAVKEGLKPLVIHFDNHWNKQEAKDNMLNLIQKLGVDSITYTVNKKEYDELNDAFLKAGIPDCDIPNDIAMTKLMYDTAVKYGIKYILNGHDFRTEGSTPSKWTYMDGKYIQSVYFSMTGKNLNNFPVLTFWNQVYYGLKGIKNIRPFYFIRYIDIIRMNMKREIGWKDYGGKHAENIYTEFIGSFVLPVKFGIDKRRVYYSAHIRSGKMNKEEAKELLKQKPAFDLNKYPELKKKIHFVKGGEIRSRDDFEKYDFKKWKWVIWGLVKMKVIPLTMYVKYCKN